MNIFKIVLSATLILSSSVISHADSVVISFADGKTQTITLDGSINSITAVRYLPSSVQTPPAPVTVAPQVNTTAPTPPQEAKQPQQQTTPAKPIVKFKWADPIIGQ